jgi:hypothetical protein
MPVSESCWVIFLLVFSFAHPESLMASRVRSKTPPTLPQRLCLLASRQNDESAFPSGAHRLCTVPLPQSRCSLPRFLGARRRDGQRGNTDGPHRCARRTISKGGTAEVSPPCLCNYPDVAESRPCLLARTPIQIFRNRKTPRMVDDGPGRARGRVHSLAGCQFFPS